MTDERIVIGDKGRVRDLKLFLSACRTVKREPAILIEKDHIKVECGGEELRFYGDYGHQNFEVYEISEPFACQLSTKDIIDFIDKDTDRLELNPLRDKNAIGVKYFKNLTVRGEALPNPTLESELECRPPRIVQGLL